MLISFYIVCGLNIVDFFLEKFLNPCYRDLKLKMKP